MKFVVATSQFPVSADIPKNFQYIRSQMIEANARRAHVVHFPECALSGYAGPDFPSYDGFDWPVLDHYMKQVLALAHQLKLWVVLGSTHRLTGHHKPHNSLYIINTRGDIVDRYDKMFCAGDAHGTTSDLAHYTSGDHFSLFTINGITCGALICHDYRYPELYREYKKRNIQLMFHSYHTGGISADAYNGMQKSNRPFAHMNEGATYPAITMPATMRSYAANNHVWISCPNSSRRESCWPSFFVRPDGVITGRLMRNRAGILMSTIDTERRWYDSTAAWRDRAMNGEYHSGVLVKDPRSKARTKL